MVQNQRSFWKKYVANAQLDLSIAAKTKVPLTWNDQDYVPEFNKLYFILEGEGYVKINNQTFYPQPGELYLLPAGSLQSYGTLNDNTFRKYWCHFTAKLGEVSLFQVIKLPTFINIQHPKELITKFEQLIYYSKEESLASEFRIHAILLEIIALLVDECGQVDLNIGAGPTFEKMDVVLNFIENHLGENITIDQLAQIANFHPNYFIRIFKDFTSFSPIQYINRRRMEKSKNQLAMTDTSVSMIADSLGMELAYFSRMFREQTGFSPTAYREMVSRSTITSN
jgi:AraC family transcriptional regulator, arabinose operon regulatory protein